MLVAANPEPASGGSLQHASGPRQASWPWRCGRSAPGGGVLWCHSACAAVAAVATGVLFGLLAWFGAELIMRGAQIGLAERVLTGAQAVWPLAVVLTCLGGSSWARLARISRTC